MRVLVTGGTGRLAQHVFSRPGAAAYGWRILSRRPSSNLESDHAVGDLVTGSGLAAALKDIEVVLHLASNPTRPADDVRAAGHLVCAAAAAGISHIVFLSIIGVDRIPYAYYQAKLKAEGVLTAGPVPCTILRAAQFHSFIDWLFARSARVPGLLLVPAGFSVQSVADMEMAERLLQVLREPPAGRIRDFAGPEILSVADAARIWRTVRNSKHLVIPIPVLGAVARAFRTGANTAPGGDRGNITWTEWLRNAQRS